MPSSTIIKLDCKIATAYVAHENDTKSYAYGGTRLMSWQAREDEISHTLHNLMLYESALKNRLINKSIEKNAFADISTLLPTGFLHSKVTGARCIIQPRDEPTYKILSNPNDPKFQKTIGQVLEVVGAKLSELGGKVKLTPDFGRFSGVSDILHKFTPHALGVSCDVGGCGGKTSYSSTGVVAAIEHFKPEASLPITLIGSSGAMGQDVKKYILKNNFPDFAVCDVVNDPKDSQNNLQTIPATFGKFTNSCLSRGGMIVATTVGHELRNSIIASIPCGTILILAHNLSVPMNKEGVKLMQKIKNQGVIAIPGQMLTLGGALTSRLEWFSRQAKIKDFDKKLAHTVVETQVKFLLSEILEIAKTRDITPFEAMLDYAEIEI